MAKKPETKFKERVREALDTIPNVVAFKIQQLSIRGTPDFLICAAGTFIALELKSSDKELPDPLQRWNIERINNAQGIALVMNPENFKKILNVITILATGGKYDRT